MKLQGMIINNAQNLHSFAEFVSASKEKLASGFTNHYLPLFYSGSADAIMQNIAIALIGSIVSLVDLKTITKTIKTKLPGLKAIAARQEDGLHLLTLTVCSHNFTYQITFSHPGKILIEDFKKLAEITGNMLVHLNKMDKTKLYEHKRRAA